MQAKCGVPWVVAGVCLVLSALLPAVRGAGPPPANAFGNPSFEFGRDGWEAARAGATERSWEVDREDAADGQYSALLTIGKVESWGLQFGQSLPAGTKGRTYTFAAFAKAVRGTPRVRLEIERRAQPYDRAAATAPVELGPEWRELHGTFAVDRDFPEGWFAYLSCDQADVQFRVDMFRLQEGPYVPLEELRRRQEDAVAVRLYDTGRQAPAPLPGAALLAREGWTRVPEDALDHVFRGDAALVNDRIAAVFRRGAEGVEIYALGPGEPQLRATAVPLFGTVPPTLQSWKTIENGMGEGTVEAAFTAAGRANHLRCRLLLGQAFLETAADDPKTRLRVVAPSRFVVLPDFFADDIVIDARELPVSAAELPSDHFLLQMLPDHEAIVMTVSKVSAEDMVVNLEGEGEARRVASCDTAYGEEGRIWVAVLAGRGVWHEFVVSPGQAGQTTALDWSAPFRAQWRLDWRRDDGLADSWEMVVQLPDGSYTKDGMFGSAVSLPANRKRWTTVLGNFPYPCWIDTSGRGYIQPLQNRALRFEGPALVYPLHRSRETDLTMFTVVDLVRATLGVGPCEYVLDVEGQQSSYRGRATCSVRDTLNPIYAARQQQQRRAEIEKVLQELVAFVRHIRDRIEGYVAFGHETLAYLARQKQEHPELAAPLSELETLARVIDAKVAARREKISTPEDVQATADEFRRTVLDSQGEDAPARCRKFTEAWVVVGGNQDELAGECRWAAKVLRQRAGLLLATDPRLADIAREIRRRSQDILRHPAGHEGARH
ncbi:MAG: carbohydrate binding domain-containing protein [Lentisphaeria bacterium]|nr:carbohydrate binding domain-containing protein [Lentisphaeria bacterium]